MGWLDNIEKAQTGKKVLKETEADRAKKVVKKVAGATGIGLVLDQFPGVETTYDAYNVIDAYRQGDPMKILSNMIGALIPGTSGKAFEAITDEYLPKTPEKEKNKMKAVLKGKRAAPEKIRKIQESIDWSEGFKKLYNDISDTDIIDNVTGPLMGFKNGGRLDNYNDSKASAPKGFQGEGYSLKGRNYSPAWGGQFQDGGKLKFLQPTDKKLPIGGFPRTNISSEVAISIGGENGEPAYLIPSFKYGTPLKDPIAEFRKTGEHLGGPFKTWKEADKWEKSVRHPAVEKGQNIQFPIKEFKYGGEIMNVASLKNPIAQTGYNTGDKVKYGTPEYREAYDKGEVVTDEGVHSPIALPEVVIKRKKAEKNWLEEYKDKIVEENRDAGVLGAIIGTPISAITSLPQLAMMKLFTDKMQRPSEAIGFDTQESLFESPSSFGKHASNFVLDAVTDPANLIGAGILTKENLAARMAKSSESGLISKIRTTGKNIKSTLDDGIHFNEKYDKVTSGIEGAYIEKGKLDTSYTLPDGTRVQSLWGETYDIQDQLHQDKRNIIKNLPYSQEFADAESKFTQKSGQVKQFDKINDNAVKLSDTEIVDNSQKSLSLGLTEGNSNLIDLQTGQVHNVKVEIPNNQKKITLNKETGEVTNTIQSGNEPIVSDNYFETVNNNVKFIEEQLPGAKVYGSAKHVSTGKTPHIIGDYDVLMTQKQYEKHFPNHSPDSDFAIQHEAPGEFGKGVKMEINVIREENGLASGDRALELFKQVDPDGFFEASKTAIKNKTRIKIPYTPEQLLEKTNATVKTVMDAYEAHKNPKNISKIDGLIHYSDPNIIIEGQEAHVKSLVGSKGTIGHQFNPEQLSDLDTNLKILEKIKFKGDLKRIAKDPKRMQAAINDYFIDNTVYVREVKNDEFYEKALKEYSPEQGGGSANGIGQNHVSKGFPQHVYDPITGVKQIGITQNTKSPLDFVDAIDQQTSATRLFSKEDIDLVSSLSKKYLGDVDLNPNNVDQLMRRLPYDSKGKEFLYEFAKKTDRHAAKVENNIYGTGNYTSMLRDFDDAIDSIIYSYAQDFNINNTLKSKSMRDENIVNQTTNFTMPQINTKDKFSKLSNILDGGLEKAKSRLKILEEKYNHEKRQRNAKGEKIYELKNKELIETLKEKELKYESEHKRLQQQLEDLDKLRIKLWDAKQTVNTWKLNLGISAGMAASAAGIAKLHKIQTSPEKQAERQKFQKERERKQKSEENYLLEQERKRQDKFHMDKIRKSTDSLLLAPENYQKKWNIDPFTLEPKEPNYNKPIIRPTNKKKNGGIIESDRGQWDHPGKITRIKGGNITMKPDPKTGKRLTKPLLGIANTGQMQMMYPGEDYNFPNADFVTEIPKNKLAKNGLRQEQKSLQNLDQLTNFTNYNKKQTGRWLDNI